MAFNFVNLSSAKVMQPATAMCFTDSVEPKSNVRIWLEVGHTCEPRRAAPGRAAAHKWCVWVRGVAGADIAAFVRKLVFQLRPVNKFPYPERVFDEPPYLVRSCGFVPTEILISVFLKNTTRPEGIHLKYGPLSIGAGECKAGSRCIFYDVRYPSEELQMAMPKPETASQKNGSVSFVLPDSGEVYPHRQTLKTSVQRPMQHKQVLLVKNSSKRGISKRKINLRPTHRNSVKQTGSNGEMSQFVSPIVPMKLPPTSFLKQDEFQHLHQMCSAQSMYLMSGRELPLPPLWDPLYSLPAPPASLAADEPDYVLQ